MKSLLATATRPRVKDLLSIEIRRLETELLSLKATEPSGETVPKPATSSITRFTCDINNYGWDQSEKFVKLFVTLPGVQTVPAENVKVNYNNQDVEVIVQDLNNKDHKLTIKNLLESVVVDKSHHKVKTDMVVVFMSKEKIGKKWDYLTKTAQKVNSNSKAEAAADLMEGDNADPNAALMNIMKKMYETGDAQTKQMIAKAYTENMNKSSELN